MFYFHSKITKQLSQANISLLNLPSYSASARANTNTHKHTLSSLHCKLKARLPQHLCIQKPDWLAIGMLTVTSTNTKRIHSVRYGSFVAIPFNATRNETVWVENIVHRRTKRLARKVKQPFSFNHLITALRGVWLFLNQEKIVFISLDEIENFVWLNLKNFTCAFFCLFVFVLSLFCFWVRACHR